jgi:hypothetical protein
MLIVFAQRGPHPTSANGLVSLQFAQVQFLLGGAQGCSGVFDIGLWPATDGTWASSRWVWLRLR